MLLLCSSLYTDSQDKKNGLKRLGWATLTIGIILLLSVLTTFYVTYSGQKAPYITGVQGRYFIPALAFLFYGASRLVPIRVEMTERQAAWVFGIANAACLCIGALYYYLATY
jgi:hypothetical protein